MHGHGGYMYMHADAPHNAPNSLCCRCPHRDALIVGWTHTDPWRRTRHAAVYTRVRAAAGLHGGATQQTPMAVATAPASVRNPCCRCTSRSLASHGESIARDPDATPTCRNLLMHTTCMLSFMLLLCALLLHAPCTLQVHDAARSCGLHGLSVRAYRTRRNHGQLANARICMDRP